MQAGKLARLNLDESALGERSASPKKPGPFINEIRAASTIA
jgi:hypothetical protein